MDITFHGAALRVTGSCALVECAGKRVLVDCGMIQGDKDAEELNRAAFPFSPSGIDALVLTHGHLDHSGRIPLLCARGFQGPIFTHAASAELAELVWLDSARLSAFEDEEPLYTEADVEKAKGQLRTVGYGEATAIDGGRQLDLRLVDAGHILGSAHAVIAAEGKRLLMSGDVGVNGTPIIRDPHRQWDAPVDRVVIESTYGDRGHRGREETLEEFAGIVREATERRGVVLIPAFAIGRTQELLFHFRELMRSGRMGEVPVILDSPMAEKATDIYRRHVECYDAETAGLMKRGELPMTFPGLREIASVEQSRQIKDLRPPAIVVAGSGMCAGGRILHHLRTFLPKESTTVVFVGFQGQGTLGRRLVDGEKRISIHGQPVEVRARVATLNGFSAHADQAGLLEWARAIPGSPHFLVNHGEEKSAEGLRAALLQSGRAAAQVAQPGQRYAVP